MSARKGVRRQEFESAWADAVHATHVGQYQEMVSLLSSPWPDVRAHVAREIGKRYQQEAVLPLIELAAHEEDESVRRAVALALTEIGDARASETLWVLFEDGAADVRFAALQGLSRLGDEGVIPVAREWYRSDDRLLRALAVFDLAILQTPSGERTLAELLAAERNWRRRFENRRAMRRAQRWRERH